MISDTLKIDKAWKFVQGIGLSSPGKEFYEEDSADSGFTLHGDDIYVNDIPSTPPGVSSTIVEVVTDFVLINDISVPGNLSWYASTDGSTLEQMRATRQADWIPPRFGQGYTVVLKDNTGQQIFTTDPINWVFDYKTGILVCESDPDVSYTFPLKLTGYRYIGERLTGIGGTAAWIDIEDVGDYFTSDNVEDALQELGLGLDNTNTNLSNHLSDVDDAHDASAISVLDSGDNYTGTNVEDVLTEIATSIGAIVLEAANVSVADVGGYFVGTDVEAVLAELAVEVDANTSGIGTLTTIINDHFVDAIDAHDASAISVADTDGRFTAIEVEGVLLELWNSVDSNTSSILAHIHTSDEAHSAVVISIVDTLDNFTSSDVDGALAELVVDIETNIGNIANNTSEIALNSTDMGNHLSDTIDAHDASSISVLDTAGYYAGTEVEAVLAELGLAIAIISSAAADVTVADVGGYFDSDNVEGVLAELAIRVDTNTGDILNNTANIAVNVVGIAANVDSIAINATAISTNATNLTIHINDIDDAHDASAISVLDTGDYIDATDVEDALNELIIGSDDNEAKILEHEVRISDIETGNSNTNEYTPTGTADTVGNEGDVTYDDDFVYVKTSSGWQRSALSTF
jgi:hypothetical protein